MRICAHFSSRMPRLPRFVLPGYPHHVTQRGNDRQRVFFDEQDYNLYRRMLFSHAAKHQVAILAYCLMPNHIHAVCVPTEKTALTRLFRGLQGDYSRYLNVRRERCGHLWQARFYSAVMDHNHTFRAMAYIEQNPVRAALTPKAEDWSWSSARIHLAGQDHDGNLDTRLWSQFYTPSQWNIALATSIDDEAWIRRFRDSSHRGYAIADEQFIAQFQAGANRNLIPAKPGRKPGHSNLGALNAHVAQAALKA